MKKVFMSIAVAALVLLSALSVEGNKVENSFNLYSGLLEYETEMKRDILCIMMAYPGYITDIEKSSEGNVYIVMKSGKRILYDDKSSKGFNEKLANADLQDMMEQDYPLNDINTLMPENNDPGRIRSYPLLKEVYGGTKGKVQSNLTNVGNSQFNKSNGAAASLKSVMKELVPLAQRQGRIGACVFPMSGTFNYRVIAGTNQLSPHAFGIAIDLARDKRDYWKWASRKEGDQRLKSYPREIVNIFEKNGFIWGGKWSHFDILHFEYRPELIIKSRCFSGRNTGGQSWYTGVPEDEMIKGYIDIIDSRLK